MKTLKRKWAEFKEWVWPACYCDPHLGKCPRHWDMRPL